MSATPGASTVTPSSALAPHLQLHVATLLFGIAGVIGRATSLSPFTLVEARASLAAFALIYVAWIRKLPLGVELAHRLWFVMLGLLLAFHWYSFFHAIQLSGVTIGLLSFSSFPIFVVLLAPYVDRSRMRKRDLILVPVMLIGLRLMLPGSDIDLHNLAGPLWGLASGLTFAIMQIVGRVLVKHHSPIKVSAYQNAIAALVLLPFMVHAVLPETGIELGEILFLGLFCTALAHTLFISGMRSVTAQTASMFTYLEPVYGIGMAALLLHEIPSVQTLSGGVIILASVFLASRPDER
ncbi:drug/metabolite transporter (DMT)-like permease [Paraburkholderia sp. HC6.4b]|uniref:Threonine/homoserine efflux transporter RhtA n=1 Tax=Paraburkholderia tuberum TaxID=157910 RepID=A0A1H1KD70_9BURK|nr:MULTISPECIES: DMT family transporter [Paraburkholderia]MBB5411218.1 drug/metabolite transporter (DMT)-like permease [Paraburkholderia sp. HC6.4b]MBB5453990.1 drug/metabolite transporter (DMT)-like permease [Paraburkholderia sp. Kb1A]SDR59987.1 Threonine/homoserine efflux transporter RhtA [Paraburkholderia tuberum]